VSEQSYRVYRIERKKRRIWRVLAVGLVLLVGGLAGSGAWLARAETGSLPPGIEIGGVDVGGRSLAEARALLEREAARVLQRQIVLAYDGGALETSGAKIGAEALIDEALAKAKDSRDTLSRLRARLGLTEPLEFQLAYAVDPARLDAALEQVAKEIERKPLPARVQLAGDEIVVVPSRTGVEVDLESAAEELMLLPARVELTLRDVPPPISDDEAEDAKAIAEKLLTDPPAVVYRKTRLELPPAVVLEALGFRRRSGEIRVTLDPAPLEKPLRRAFRAWEREPRDATFKVRGKRVSVVRSRPGRAVDAERVAAAIAAHPERAAVGAAFAQVEPELTTEKAKALKITELVSEFTTPYPCCAPRVTNIQLAAEILDGSIIRPGARFSLNEALGPRTAERGFVLAPMIQAGKLVDAVGGGVSQVATTFYNAAFFAGLELIEHTPHEFYISRYPMGREATVSWGGPELVFRNDWPAAILIKVSAGDTSITVRFYSTKLGRRVETTTGDPYNYTSATTVRVFNPSLAPGTEEVVQSGGISGFTVEYTRKVWQGKKLRRDEHWVVRYRPENTIVEYGPKPAGGKPAKDGQSGGQGGGQGDAETAPPGDGATTEPPPPPQ
jgi:vancomycin resistance protein YoaR